MFGFANDSLQKSVVASVIGETANPPGLANPILLIPMRLDMDNANHVAAGCVVQVMVRQVVALVAILVGVVLPKPVDVGIDDALRIDLRHGPLPLAISTADNRPSYCD